jgi:hypothetical protein
MNNNYDISKLYKGIPPALLAYAAYKILRGLADRVPKQAGTVRPKMAEFGTTAGKGLARVRDAAPSQQQVSAWMRKYIPVAVATYVLLAGIVISFGYFSSDAMLIGCPAFAAAVSYLWNRDRGRVERP